MSQKQYLHYRVPPSLVYLYIVLGGLYDNIDHWLHILLHYETPEAQGYISKPFQFHEVAVTNLLVSIFFLAALGISPSATTNWRRMEVHAAPEAGV